MVPHSLKLQFFFQLAAKVSVGFVTLLCFWAHGECIGFVTTQPCSRTDFIDINEVLLFFHRAEVALSTALLWLMLISSFILIAWIRVIRQYSADLMPPLHFSEYKICIMLSPQSSTLTCSFKMVCSLCEKACDSCFFWFTIPVFSIISRFIGKWSSPGSFSAADWNCVNHSE